MGKMEQMLKSEITRLAKKQMWATYLPLAQDVRRLKRTVSALRKTVTVLAKLGTELQAERTVSPVPPFAGPTLFASAGERLGLSVQSWRKSVFSQPLAATDRYKGSANPSQRRGRPRALRGRPAFLNAAANRSNRAAFLSPALAP